MNAELQRQIAHAKAVRARINKGRPSPRLLPPQPIRTRIDGEPVVFSVPDAVIVYPCQGFIEQQDAHVTAFVRAQGGYVGSSPAMALIIACTCRHFQIATADLLSDRRTHDVIRPRQIAFYLAREMTKKSWGEIGRRFGRDHTTALHSHKTISKIRDAEPFAADIASIMTDVERRWAARQ